MLLCLIWDFGRLIDFDLIFKILLFSEFDPKDSVEIKRNESIGEHDVFVSISFEVQFYVISKII